MASKGKYVMPLDMDEDDDFVDNQYDEQNYGSEVLDANEEEDIEVDDADDNQYEGEQTNNQSERV